MAREIKLRLKAGEPPKSIARAFGLSDGAVYHIKTGRTWGEIHV
jgi:DNA invertase Pin-like site-specific DNA recombinase